MPLTLLIGPASAPVTRAVLERHRAEGGRAPILVVPTAADVDRYRRELAAAGAVLDTRVEPFAGLGRELARRGGLGRVEPLGAHARERVVAAAIARAPLDLLRASAAAPGFLRATVRLVAELGARRIEPARLAAALRAWPRGGRRGVEVAALYAAYRRRLERLGRLDAEQLATCALDALRIAPGRWRGTPVLFAGFDDLDPLQLDTIETLARAAPVVVALAHEPGRAALAVRAATFETLRPLADEIVVLEPQPGEPTLLHLERTLFDDDAPREPCGEALVLIEGETERDELELVAAEIRGLIDDGCPPDDIAVVMRTLAGRAELVAEVLGERGIPLNVRLSQRFRDTATGRGLIGLLRAALEDGGPGDLLAWLRVPGLLERPELADHFEARVRRGGEATWEHFPLVRLERLRAARGPSALLERTSEELDRLLAAGSRRGGRLLDDQARVAAAAARCLAELRELTAADPALGPSPSELIATLARVELDAPPRPGVLVCDTLALPVRAVFLCGLTDGAFPALGREPPYFSADERVEIGLVSGLRLGALDDPLAAERCRFYTIVARARERLRVSWHRTRDDGSPASRSAFVDDVRAVFSPEPEVRRRASQGDLAEPFAAGSGASPGAGRAPLGQLRSAAVLAALAARAAESPSSLEAWTACPVGWFVERLLAAEPLAPAAEPLARGTVAHAVLAQVVGELCAAGPLGSADTARTRELVRAALAERAGALSPSPERDRAARRRLEADLERYLTSQGARAHEPLELELAFGLDGAEHPAVALAGGRLRVRGRIDRIDVDPAAGTAIVHDYKSGEVLGAAKWEERGKLALGLYMLAAAELLGVEVVGGLYQPVRGTDLRPRGALRGDVEPDLATFATDRVAAAELDDAVASALERALAAADELRAGALEPRPLTCTRGGVCRHPAICGGGR